MKVFLLHRDRDFDVKPALRDEIFDAMLSSNLFALTYTKRNRKRPAKPAPAAPPGTDDVLAQDLELGTLWSAMAGGDEFLFETAKRAVLSSLHDPEAIVYRQRVLADCLQRPTVVRQLYGLAVEALENERTAGGGLWHSDRPDSTLYRSVQVLRAHVDVLKRLRQLADQQAGTFRSEGFTRFFAMLREELADDYLQAVEQHLRELGFSRGVFESARLGQGDKGHDYIVRRLREQRWTERLPFGNRTPDYSFTIPPRDQAGFQALEEIRGKGINLVANAVAQAAEHISSFFIMLRLELAFYLGCLNLHERLEQKSEPTCFPEPLAEGQPSLTTHGIYDVCLTLHIQDRVVGNEVHADGKPLVMITGANQGGKLDEELSRMSQIAGQIAPHSLLLCNESFASTNEREASEIARQVIRAMLDKQIKVIFVTHMYDLAHGLHEQQLDAALFLRAERQPDGRRTFKILEGKPLPTSYGEDSYRRIFQPTATAPAAAAYTER